MLKVKESLCFESEILINEQTCMKEESCLSTKLLNNLINFDNSSRRK